MCLVFDEQSRDSKLQSYALLTLQPVVRNIQYIMICPSCVQQSTPNVAFLYMYINFDMEWLLDRIESCYTRNCDLVLVTNERTLNNTVNASLRTLFITLFVICSLKYIF